MAGIYIHIPFCKKACHYCNFHFSTSLEQKNNFVSALFKEMEMMSPSPHFNSEANDQAAFRASEVIETIYFGGGTPSLLSEAELRAILAVIYERYHVDRNAEVTLEANPDDISLLQLKEWKAAGINRLSVGVQSFFDEDLQWMNRAHNSQQALQAIEMAFQEGFFNITADLIYGTPFLTNDKWEANVQRLISLGVPHLSCYALTVEPSTALHTMINQKKMPDVDPEKQATQFLLLTDWLQDAGYEHYEISNFAKPGMRSRHNSAYWRGKTYLGFGPSAHSFNGISRKWNIANNALYIQSLQNGVLRSEIEHLTPVQQLNEYVMISLRTMEGLNLPHVADKFGEDAKQHILQQAQQHISNGNVASVNETLYLTRDGKLFADGIAADLFR